MATSIDVSDLNIYYGDFLAVEDVTIPIGARSVTAIIGPSGCGKSTFLRSLNRMHEVIPGARVEGKVLVEGQDLYGADMDPVDVRRMVGMVFQRPNPFPTMSIYDNVLAGQKLNSKRMKKGEADGIVEASLRKADLWTEVKDRLNQSRLEPLRRSAAAAVHRPGDLRRAGGAAHGRAVLGTRPDLDERHRGPHPRAQGAVTRSSSSRTTCSRRRGSPTRRRSSTCPVSARPGRLIEVGRTEKIFSNPDETSTEAYIQGRFG